jgi:hypothetical protein
MSDEIRRRFSMVDALVVGVVLFLLAALLFPAVNVGRVPARRTQCMNNIRSLALANVVNATRGANGAFGGYLEALPIAGATMTPEATEPPDSRREIIVAWPTKLLPALDEMTLYEQLLGNDDYRELIFDSPFTLEIFLCPSDPQIDPAAGGLSYVANTGMPDLVEASEGQPSDLRANGVCHDQRPGRFGPKVRMTDVKDGQSTTILLSENIHRDPPGSAQQPGNTWLRPATGATNLEQWYGMVWVVDPQSPRSPLASLMERFNRDTRPESQQDQPYAASGTRFARPSSNHAGVVNVAFCGGNAREISENIDYAVYQQLMTPDGQKAAPADAPAQRFEKTLPENQRFMNPPITDADY